MKKILLSLLTLITVCGNSQTVIKTFYYNEKPVIKFTDYDLHAHTSAAMTGFLYSSVYHFTRRKGLATLTSFAGSLFVGIVLKEVIHDKYLKLGTYNGLDTEADIKGTVTGAFFSFCINDTYEKRKNKIDSLKFQFPTPPPSLPPQSPTD